MSRIKVTIYIFDLGGVPSCLQGVLVDSPECIQKQLDRQWRSESPTMRTWFIFKKGGLSGLILTSTSIACDVVVLSRGEQRFRTEPEPKEPEPKLLNFKNRTVYIKYKNRNRTRNYNSVRFRTKRTVENE